jgi:16S rRNA (cytidine1402-2'-O)-methyltransferase
MMPSKKYDKIRATKTIIMKETKISTSTGKLYVVATPIGNLGDITLRALETLKTVDFVVAEDTRITKKLLSHYDIHKPLISLHEHSKEGAYEKITQHLSHNKSLAFVTDAGTPAISDPGAKLINHIHENLTEISIIPIPGPSALTTALSAAGINADKFTFMGYPPHKKGRETFFNNLKEIKIKPIVIYESPHRLAKTLEQLEEAFSKEKKIIIAKELTKIHEEVWHGTIENAQTYFVDKKAKGEFVIIV